MGQRVHDYCYQRDVPVWCGGMLETGVGRAANVAIATLPGFILPGDISASERYFKRDIIEQPFELNDDSTLTVHGQLKSGSHRAPCHGETDLAKAELYCWLKM